MSPSEIRALAVDYDRTLTDPDLRIVPEALDALRAARDRGLRVAVVSGRSMGFLAAQLEGVADVLVAENGCILRERDGRLRPLGKADGDLRAALARVAAEIEYGDVVAAADVEHEPLLREALRRAGLARELVRNRDRVMILPPGVDKAAGFLAAMQALGVEPSRAAAAGDAENDAPMLRAAGYAIAVANAVDELKGIADHVTAEPGGHGIASWIRSRWLQEGSA